MYCSNCGTRIPDGTTVCPNCSPTPVTPAPENGKLSFLKSPGKMSKSYAALFTAFLVFPAAICVAVDVAFDKYDYWFGYVVGALLVTWVVLVLPVLRVTPPAVTALICFGTITGYVYYILSKTDWFEGLPEFILPMFVLTAAFVAIDSALIGSKKIKGLHILSLLSLECALYLVAWEVIIDQFKNGVIDLGWSLILSCGFISVIAVLEAFAYVGRLNKK
ncbi:MAG: zinc ribbon domain-containing protein [Clostridia bacterium]|nr:zinc ribbon domain-containing protein [Clostridia bacterium]